MKRKRKQQRKRLLKISQVCHYCGTEIDLLTSTSDHKVPRCRGGANDDDNVVLSCRDCNTIKADMDYEMFVTMVAPYLR